MMACGGSSAHRMSRNRNGSKPSGSPSSNRSASAVALPGPRMHPGGAGGRHHCTGAFPTPLPPAARSRSTELQLVRRGAPAPPSRPGRLSNHRTPPVGNAGFKEENR
jgi:hypothetical protein